MTSWLVAVSKTCIALTPARVKKTRPPSGLSSRPRGVLSSDTRATSFHAARSSRTIAVAPCCWEATQPVCPSRLSVPL